MSAPNLDDPDVRAIIDAHPDADPGDCFFLGERSGVEYTLRNGMSWPPVSGWRIEAFAPKPAADAATTAPSAKTAPQSLFKGIEGARAWLAWAVVGTHIATYGGVAGRLPHGVWLHIPGDYAVQVFIVISGFVITHLIMTKHEPYGLFIARRFLRIFPAYLICLFAAVIIEPLTVQAVESYKFSDSYQLHDYLVQAQQFHRNLWEHIAAHLLLLQGVLSNRMLPDSQTMFLPPAWSLSLEWQFYLFAPAWIYGLVRHPIVTVTASVIAWALFEHLMSGAYGAPSVLPGAALFFLMGMATRLVIERAPKLANYPFAAMIGCAALILIDKRLITVVVWAALVAYFQQPRKWAILDSPLAKAAGARSFSVYMIHLPVFFLALAAADRLMPNQFWPVVVFSGLVTVLGTLICSELLFRYVETPAINFARTIGDRRAPIGPAAERSGW